MTAILILNLATTVFLIANVKPLHDDDALAYGARILGAVTMALTFVTAVLWS